MIVIIFYLHQPYRYLCNPYKCNFTNFLKQKYILLSKFEVWFSSVGRCKSRVCVCYSPPVTHSQMSSVTVYHDVLPCSVCGLFLKAEREAMWSGGSPSAWWDIGGLWAGSVLGHLHPVAFSHCCLSGRIRMKCPVRHPEACVKTFLCNTFRARTLKTVHFPYNVITSNHFSVDCEK